MDKISSKAGVFIVGFLALCIGLVLAIQISTTSGSDQGGLVPIAKLKSYEAELKKVRDEKEIALVQLLELEERLAAIETEKSQEDNFVKGMVTDLEKYKMSSGVVDVQGTGVFVTVKEPTKNDEYQKDFSIINFNSDLLISLVNKLKEAGAEAVSINEQRIVATTEISLAGSNININGIPTAPPYYIKAIGNPQTLDAAINIRAGTVEDMKKLGLMVDTQKKDEITISRYSGTIAFKYAKPVVPDENAE